jgi:hypothetical protein
MPGPDDVANLADGNDYRMSVEPAARQIPSIDNPLGVRHRRRFIANPPPRIEPSLNDEEEEFPILTEEVGVDSALAAEDLAKALANILASDMAYAIEQHLAAELPALIESTLLNAKEELRSGVSETVTLALRNFLARREQIRLPSEDPSTL